VKPGEKGLSRIVSATRYSWLGIKAAWTHEAAFRQELILLVIGMPLAVYLARDMTDFLFLSLPLLLLLLAELTNSAIEAVVDRFGNEHHELSGRAKDMGSAVVFMALVIVWFSWITVAGSILGVLWT
jgi:diacylglycerol kinase (ATP)